MFFATFMEKASFYEGLNGGNMWEIHALIMLPLCSVLFEGSEFILCWVLFLGGVTVFPWYLTAIGVYFCFFKWLTSNNKRVSGPPYDSITAFKSLMMIMTIVAILAVDFQIFDRKYAKTELYGTSLMDIGVGTFIYSGGLMFGLRHSNSLLNVIIKAIPVWFIGAIRLVSVKFLNYHEHLTEYGVHWNFFFTLGAIPVWAAITNNLRLKSELFGYCVGIAYQCALEFGVMDYLIKDNRETLFSKNKEGIFSCIGYLCLWILAADISKYLNHQDYTKKVFTRLFVNSVIVLFCIYILDIQISRRATNLPFILWCCSVCDVYMWILQYKEIKVPNLLKKINNHQLSLFLIANLLTGAINFMFDTQNMGAVESLTILVNYCLFITVVANSL